MTWRASSAGLSSSEETKARARSSATMPGPGGLFGLSWAQLNPTRWVMEFLDAPPPRPGNPADLRRVWTWAGPFKG